MTEPDDPVRDETLRDGPDPFREWDAAYVLGALSPADRREFEEHLRTCADCRAAVAALAGMPGLLHLVPADEAISLVAVGSPEPPGARPGAAPSPAGAPAGPSGDSTVPAAAAGAGSVASLAAALRRRRRRVRAALVGVAAALLLLGGTAGALLAWDRPPAVQAVALSLEPVGDAAVTADLTLQERAWGTRLDWSCRYATGVPAGYADPVYELVVVDDAGVATVVATWQASGDEARGLGASSSIPTDTIARVEIRLRGSSEPVASAVT